MTGMPPHLDGVSLRRREWAQALWLANERAAVTGLRYRVYWSGLFWSVSVSPSRDYKKGPE